MRVLSVFVLCVMLIAGCSSNGRVSGKVVLDDEPVARADLVFEAVDFESDRYTGITTKDGTIQMSYRRRSGLPPGKYKVVVTRYTLPDGGKLPAGEKGDAWIAEEKAAKHKYVFEKAISGGNNEMVFKLSEGKKLSDG